MTVIVAVVVLVMPPPVAVIVSVLVPIEVFVAVVIVSVDVPALVIDGGLNDADAPDGSPLTDNDSVPVNPFTALIVTV